MEEKVSLDFEILSDYDRKSERDSDINNFTDRPSRKQNIMQDFGINNIFKDKKLPTSTDLVSSTGNPLKNVNVLVVDDSPICRRLMLNKFVRQDPVNNIRFTIDTADNGEQALTILENSLQPPDVIIIDQDMSQGGGILLGHEVVEKLRVNPHFQSVVIVGCTGFYETANQCLITAGCDAVWAKPMPPMESVINQLLTFVSIRQDFKPIESQNSVKVKEIFEQTTFTEGDENAQANIAVFKQIKVFSEGFGGTDSPRSTMESFAEASSTENAPTDATYEGLSVNELRQAINEIVEAK